MLLFKKVILYLLFNMLQLVCSLVVTEWDTPIVYKGVKYPYFDFNKLDTCRTDSCLYLQITKGLTY